MSNLIKKVYTYEKPSRQNFVLTFIGMLGCMLIFAFVVFLAYLPNRPEPVDHAIVQERKERLAALRAEEHKILTSYGWINQEQGIVRIPVERAMSLVLPTLNEPQKQGLTKILDENAIATADNNIPGDDKTKAAEESNAAEITTTSAGNDETAAQPSATNTTNKRAKQADDDTAVTDVASANTGEIMTGGTK